MNPRLLLQTTAFAAPAYAAGVTAGVVGDAVSLRDDVSQPRYSSDMLADRQGHSQSELMESRLRARRLRVLSEAWEWFQRGEYQRARSSFRSAEMLDRFDPEPRAGAFFCCLAEQQYSQATHNMGRIFRWDAGKDIFGADYKLAQRCQPSDEQDPTLRARLGVKRINQYIAKFAEYATDNRNNPVATMALAYALWHSGYRQEAAHAARSLQQRFPNHQVARFGKKLLLAHDRQSTSPTP